MVAAVVAFIVDDAVVVVAVVFCVCWRCSLFVVDVVRCLISLMLLLAFALLSSCGFVAVVNVAGVAGVADVAIASTSRSSDVAVI